MKSYEDLQTNHPCFSINALGAKPNKGRIHLPVSPSCNISCNFCRINSRDYDDLRPAVSRGIIAPKEALETVRKARALCPEITTVGIAGPGESLATPYALQTFRLIKKEFPEVIKCMSTNGLALPEKSDEIIEIGIDSLSVTVNAIDETILARIVSGVSPKDLIEAQLKGIKKVAKAGITVKVNAVLIPEINLEHIPEVAETVSELGAKIFNVIPIIPQHKLDWASVPNCEQLNSVRAECEKYMPIFRHCQRCRADAAGIIGGIDVSKELYIRPVNLDNTFSHG